MLFLLVAPGVVVGVVPWWLTGWRMHEPFGFYWPVRVLGGLLLAGAVVFLLSSFARFVVEGIGTPAPVAPTETLVTGGVYRHVRNPMYVAVVTAIGGQALLLGRPVLLAYAAGIAVLQAAFVRLHEEPKLRQRYGEQYETYRQAVPGWWPRRRPWRGDDTPPAQLGRRRAR